MRFTSRLILTSLVITLSLVACTPPTSPPVATKVVARLTQTPTPSLTFTLSPKPTQTYTLTPTATATHTSVPTHTPSATASFTASPRPTTRPSSTATPSATIVQAQAPVFAETPILAFNVDTMIQYLGLVRDSYRSAYRNYFRIDLPGGCSSFAGWFALWVTQAPGFTDVPPPWNSLYFEYRSWIHQSVSTTWKHHQACVIDRTVRLTAEDIAAYAVFFESVYPRSEAMILEAQSLPRP